MNQTDSEKHATWVSHSSINDFINCPRLYYYRNVYRDSLTGNKITRIEPSLALGQAVHEVIESISVLPAKQRLSISLVKRLEFEWSKISGKKGGFKSASQEDEYKKRAILMLERISKNPGPIARQAIKIKSPDKLPPRYLISQEDNIILCGKIDWLEYLLETESVHIIDFKTGKWDSAGSLQLPIYYLLAVNLQGREVKKASYWYLDREDEPKEEILPTIKDAEEKVIAIAKRIKLAKQLTHFACPKGGCKYCFPYESIAKGKGKKVGESNYQDIYII